MKLSPMRTWLRDKRGASSVLCIFMMIVMIVFGTLALTSSYANLSLARRTVRSNADNYLLDNDGETLYGRVDAVLAGAEVKARETLRALAAGSNVSVPGGSEAAIAAISAEKTRNQTAAALEWLNRFYFYYASDALSQFMSSLDTKTSALLVYDDISGFEAPADFLESTLTAPDATSLIMKLSISRGDNVGDKQLTFEFDVLPLVYELKYDAGVLAGTRSATQIERVATRSWRHWQIPFVYEEGLEFDGQLIVDDPKKAN